MPATASSTDKAVIIRAGQGTLTFLTPQADGTYAHHPYAVKSSMSIAANLRTAFKEEAYLADSGRKAVLLVSTPVLLVPEEEYRGEGEFDLEAAFGSVITGHKGDVKVATPIEGLDAVAVFPVNSDLQMVVKDHFAIVDTQNVMPLVWRHTYNKYYQSGGKRRLFAYFHDKAVDIFCFEQHRVRFANTFQAAHAHDALYYTLFTWKQLGMNVREDELYIIGTMPHGDWLMERYKTYLNNVHADTDGEGNTADAGKDMPFDLKLCE